MQQQFKNDRVIRWMAESGYTVTDGVVVDPDGKPVYVRYRKEGDRHYNETYIKYKYTLYTLPHARVLLWLTQGPPKDKPRFMADHKDGNRQNDDLANLQWVSPSENVRNVSDEVTRQRVERCLQLVETHVRGKRQKCRYLTMEEAKDVRSRFRKGTTMQALAAEYGAHPMTISRVINDPNWKPHPSAARIIPLPAENATENADKAA